MASKSVYHWILLYVLDPSILAPLLAYAWSRFRDSYKQPSWIRAYLYVQVFDLVQGVIFIALALSHRNNQWFRHLTQPLVFTGLLWVLAKTSEPTPRRKHLITACLGIGLLAAVTGIFVDGLFWRNTLFTVTQSLLYIGLGTYELRRLLLQEDDQILTDKPEFWLYSAILIYGSSTLIFNASSNYFLRNLPPHLVPLPWIVNGVVIVLYQLSLAKVFLCRKPSSS